MDERILFLSRLEFAVLLIAGGITEMMCFPLLEEENVKKEQMIEAIYELVCMGCLQMDERSVRLTDFMENRIMVIQEAKQYLVIEPGDSSLVQKLCYIDDKIAVLENVQKEGKAFRFFLTDREKFWEWLEDSMELPKAAVEKKAEAEQLLLLNQMAYQERERLLSEGYLEKYSKISGWMKKIKTLLGEMPYVGIRLIRKNKTDQEIDLLICQGMMNTWFLWQKSQMDLFGGEAEKEEMHLEPDSLELRQEISNMFWRTEK